MIKTYHYVATHLAPEVRETLTERLNLPIFEAVTAHPDWHVKIVLELLRLGRLAEVETLIGKPITRCPYRAVKPYPVMPRREASLDDRVVISAVRNPRLPTTPAFQRFKHFRPGTSIHSLIKRGVTRRDIREAISNEWVRFQ